MKYFVFLITLFLLSSTQAHSFTVGHVKVSVQADSPASAQIQALDQGYQIAFQKLIAENFPERSSVPLPSQDLLKEMVTDFSIDKEKTTSNSYTAFLTFQFNEPLVLAWLDGGSSHLSSFTNQSYEENLLTMKVSYKTHREWHHLKTTLEDCPGVQALAILTLTPKNATINLTYRGPIDKLKQGLLQKGVLLMQQAEGWMVSASDLALR